MEFSIATLLNQFTDDKLVPGKVLEKKLGCQEEESGEKLQIALDALERIGILTKEFGKYRRVYEEDVVEAKLRCSSKGFCFAIQDEEGADDIYVRESNLSNAWNGDRVLVKVIKEGSRRRSPEGEVKLILERANPSLLAQVRKDDGGYRAVPLDDRLLFELELDENGQNLAAAIDHLVHVTVLRYKIAQLPPLGKVTRVLGSDAEAAVDTDIVCCKHDLPTAFSQEILNLAEKLRKEIPNLLTKEKKNRLDCRELLTITIEKKAEIEENLWVENAFTLGKTEEGHWRLGIHTVDVAEYIDADSLLDQTARKRGTTIYLKKMVLPIFPEEVGRLISLQPGKDNLTMSIFITIDETGEVVEFEIQPTVINVNHQLSYQQVQELLGIGAMDAELAPAVEMLNQLFFNVSPLVKAQRLQRGGFEISLAEVESSFKDEGRLGAIVSYSNLPVLSLLTDLLVLAGKVVADHLKALEVPGIYCIQPEPDWDELEDLLKLGNNLGLNLELESEEEVSPHDYQRLTQEFPKTNANQVLQYLLQSTLKSVKYSSLPGSHFGLAYSDGYTHCVSPGQRYVDLLIQRILKIVFDQGRDRRHARAKLGVDLHSSSCHGKINWNVLPTQIQEDLELELHEIISHLNDREKMAEDAEEDLDGLKKAEMMKERTGQVFTGLITGVQSYGFFVQIDDLLVEGLVHVSSLKDDWYEYRSRHSCLVGKKNRIAYRLGDTVEVEVKSVDYYRQQIDLATVGGGSMASSEDLEDE
ncbi:MAG: VacB/RNase II family 3'-5' exoribonuclease [Gomphosphaeria aponina SAG 52.96 = DSM 107014]|uniref:VacB/RNase II family 3'-5' exoribonuclease n=1 Tax=Gomphosphaeria aponina SAG 52.96 = DSM 107014 TaxID=1521640 RepID=A0A941JVP0_9CHRO|nr:VacB/RNase II family 3'-5' exoribonuclease [Gomphosphaeria aponina SAG 52.96 = DSM 107014]